MPAIKEISFEKGIRIVGDGIPSVDIAIVQFPNTGTLAEREAQLNKLVQSVYEYRELVNSLTPDEEPRQNPPVLNTRQRIERVGNKDYLVTKSMFVQVHLYSLNPLKYNICCSDVPIEGEWWL